MKKDSETPPDKRPLEPKVPRCCDQVDNKEQDVHTHVSAEVDVEPNLRLDPLSRPLVGLLILHILSLLQWGLFRAPILSTCPQFALEFEALFDYEEAP